jgi:hypothetical protein
VCYFWGGAIFCSNSNKYRSLRGREGYGNFLLEIYLGSGYVRIVDIDSTSFSCFQSFTDY